MNWDALGAIGEIIGAAGVIVSLLYLASQVRNNSRQLRHSSAQAVLDKLNGLIGQLAFTAGAGDVWNRGLSGLEIHWRIKGKMSESPLFGGDLERVLRGIPNTSRNMNTLRRILTKADSP
jgi:hypothetical protein